MGEAAIQLVIPDDPIPPRVVNVAQEIRALTITDDATYERMAVLRGAAQALLKEVDARDDEAIASAHKLHKDLLKRKAKDADPLKEAVRLSGAELARYDDEQEQKRLAEQRRIEDEQRKAEAAARKAEEDRQIEVAVELEEMGQRELAEQVISEPTPPPAPVAVSIPKATPKVAGLAFRIDYSAEITDLRALALAVGAGKAPTTYLIGVAPIAGKPTWACTALNRVAAAQKDAFEGTVPGVALVKRKTTIGGAK